MRKSNFKNTGDPILVFKIEHLVSASVFASALTDRYYSRGEEFPDILKKTKALEILKLSLRWFGDEGEYTDGVGDDNQEEWNNIYDDAKSWVLKNYPYLNS